MAEGMLKTPERAEALAAYMRRVTKTADELAALPPSPRRATRRNRKVPGANRSYYVHEQPHEEG